MVQQTRDAKIKGDKNILNGYENINRHILSNFLHVKNKPQLCTGE